MIADIPIPPFPTALLVVGSLLILLGLAGQVTIKEARIGVNTRWTRLLTGIIGGCLIVVSIWMDFTLLPNVAPNATPTPTPPTEIIPLAAYRTLIGKWYVVEKVEPDYGNWEIYWQYEADVSNDQITMLGKKTLVNNKHPDWNEKGALSTIKLKLKNFRADGYADETDASHQWTHSDIALQLSNDLLTFNGTCKIGGVTISTLIGTKEQPQK